MLKKATIRKEQEPDFEEKRFNVTIGEDEREFDKENEFFRERSYRIIREYAALPPHTLAHPPHTHTLSTPTPSPPRRPPPTVCLCLAVKWTSETPSTGTSSPSSRLRRSVGRVHAHRGHHPLCPTVTPTLTPTMTMRWRLSGGGDTMKTSGSSTRKPPSPTTTA